MAVTLDYKDEAAAKAIMMRKQSLTLMVDERWPARMTYVGDQAMKTDLKSLVTAKLSQSNKDQSSACQFQAKSS